MLVVLELEKGAACSVVARSPLVRGIVDEGVAAPVDRIHEVRVALELADAYGLASVK